MSTALLPCRDPSCIRKFPTSPARTSHERHAHGRLADRHLHGFAWPTFDQRSVHHSACRAKASDMAPGRP